MSPSKAEKGVKKNQNTKTTKTADIELEFTPKRVPKTVLRRKRCYQPHRHLVCEALALVNNNSVPVCAPFGAPQAFVQ